MQAGGGFVATVGVGCSRALASAAWTLDTYSSYLKQ